MSPLLPQPEDDAGERKPRVLYFDDDPAVAKVLTRMLVRCGFVVTHAPDAVVALQELQDGLHDPALILTDLVMPQMTGYQVAKAAQRLRPEIPVVLITGANADDTADGRDAVRDVLYKPCRMTDLSRILHGVLT